MKSKQTNQPFFKDSAFGWDGLITFIFSNIVLLLTLGLGFLLLLFQVIRIAVKTKTISRSKLKTVFVAGLCLNNEHPVNEYKVRLKRVLELLKNSDSNIKVILLGGITGGNQISEAQAGADYLFAQGIAKEKVRLEEKSRHTLENLQYARALLRQQKNGQSIEAEQFAIISSRYHLYRIITLAKGLQMNLQAIAAEDRFVVTPVMIYRIIKETYFLHWYWSGTLWVYLTANKKSQSRIR